MDSEKISIKCVVVGDGSVGKTCMLLSYKEDSFPTAYVPTVFDNHNAMVKVDNKMINLGLWDTAGQEEYSNLRSLSYPMSDVFIIVFSVTEPASFENAIKKWYPELEASAPGVPKLIVGNKIDLRPSPLPTDPEAKKKIIAREFGQKVIGDMGLVYKECSALSQDGLKDVFEEAIRLVLRKRGGGKGGKSDKSGGGKKSFCCLC